MAIYSCAMLICPVAKDNHPGAITYWGALPCSEDEHQLCGSTFCNNVDTYVGASLHQ